MSDDHVRMTVVCVNDHTISADRIEPGLDVAMLNALCEYTKHLDEIAAVQVDVMLYGQGALFFSGDPLNIKRIPPWELIRR